MIPITRTVAMSVAYPPGTDRLLFDEHADLQDIERKIVQFQQYDLGYLKSCTNQFERAKL